MDENELLNLFAAAGTSLPSPVDALIWRKVGGKVVGGFAWTGYTGDTVQLHFVGTTPWWMTRKLLKSTFTYSFDHLKVAVILGFLPPDRMHAVEVALKLGFKKCCVVPGVGLHMLAMTRADCKWLDLPSKRANG